MATGRDDFSEKETRLIDLLKAPGREWLSVEPPMDNPTSERLLAIGLIEKRGGGTSREYRSTHKGFEA